MGISSDGKLYFGFPLGGDDDPPDWLPEVGEGEGITEAFEELVYRDAGLTGDLPWKEREAALRACPADIFMHCSYDYGMYILGVRGVEFSASRGDIVEITPESLLIDSAQIEAFEAWCHKHDIPYQKPAWYLCSLYG